MKYRICFERGSVIDYLCDTRGERNTFLTGISVMAGRTHDGIEGALDALDAMLDAPAYAPGVPVTFDSFGEVGDVTVRRYR